MAENTNNAPILTPEQASALTDSGILTQDTASAFTPEATLTPEQLQALQTPSLEEQVQQTDFNQYDTSHLQDVNQVEDPLVTQVKNTDLSQPILPQITEEQVTPEEQITLEEQQEKDKEDIAVQTEEKKATIMDQLSSLQAAEEAEALQRQKLIDEQQSVFADMEDLKEQAKNTQVDDFWSDASTGTKIMAALAIGLGAAAGVQRGDGQNQGLQMMMNIINQQAKAKQQSFKNQLALKSAVLDKVQSQLRVLDSKTNSRVKSAQIANMKQQVLDEQQKNQAALKQQVVKSAIINKQKSQKLSQQEEVALISALSKDDRKRYVPGFGLAKDAESAKNASRQIDFGEQAISQVNKLNNLLNEHGAVEILDRGAVAEEESTRKNLQLQLKELFNLGVLNGPDLELLEQFTGGDFFSPTTLESTKRSKIKAVEVYIKNRVNASLGRAGLPKLGKSKFDNFINHATKKGLSKTEAVERYQKLVESGKINP